MGVAVAENSWHVLTHAALTEVHPTWMPTLEPELVDLACASPRGRRWLAAKLVVDFELLRQPPFALGDDAPLKEQRWLLHPLATAHGLLMEIGAFVCADRIRALVSREAVLQLRRVLGPELYQRILQYRKLSSVRSAVAASELRAWPVGDDELRARFRRLAATELYHLALSLHPLAGERVCLAFPAEWMLPGSQAQLSNDDIDVYLHRGNDEITAGSKGE